MSLYCTVITEFKNEEALISALLETKNRNGGFWKLPQIRIESQAKSLTGYTGDIRPEKAHIIIPRHYVGGSANDLGFFKNDKGVFEAIISEYDKSYYNEKWIANLKQNYAFHTIRIQQETRGRTVQRQMLPNGNQRVVINNIR